MPAGIREVEVRFAWGMVPLRNAPDERPQRNALCRKAERIFCKGDAILRREICHRTFRNPLVVKTGFRRSWRGGLRFLEVRIELNMPTSALRKNSAAWSTAAAVCGFLVMTGCPPQLETTSPEKSSSSSETPPPAQSERPEAGSTMSAPKGEDAPATAPEKSGETVRPEQAAERQQVEASVKALKELGVLLKQNAQGLVVAADAKNAPITDENIKLFVDLPGMTVLSLENAQVTNDGLKTLKQMPQLEELSLRRCTNVDDAGLVVLKDLPHLQRLLLLYTRVTNAGLEHVAPLTGLRLLDLRGCMQVGNTGLEHIKDLKNLVDVKLRSYSVTDDGMKWLGGLPHLRSISLEDCGVGDPGMVALKNLKELRSLNLMRTVVGDEGLASFSQAPLVSLSLRDTAVVGPGLDKLEVARSTLTDLDLSETRIGNDGVSHIPQFTRLQKLSLWNGSLDDEGIASLVPLKDLQELNLEGCGEVSSASAESLAKLTNLKKINLTETGFDDTGLEKLSVLKGLKVLTLSRTNVTDAGIEKFKQAVPDCTVKL